MKCGNPIKPFTAALGAKVSITKCWGKWRKNYFTVILFLLILLSINYMAFLEKLVIIQLVKKFPVFMEQRFITVSKKPNNGPSY
jgi:hypothetical protein